MRHRPVDISQEFEAPQGPTLRQRFFDLLSAAGDFLIKPFFPKHKPPKVVHPDRQLGAYAHPRQARIPDEESEK